MPRDYKDINKQAKKATRGIRPVISHLLAFVTGLSLGLFIAAFMFLQPDLFARFPKLAIFDRNTQPTTHVPGAAEKQAAANDVPIPRFEFYDILRNRKLNISETVASDQEAGNPVAGTTGVYLLQAGSFADYQSADQLKAQLALLGISAFITKVVINGKDSIHRVRIGPFEDANRLRETRQRLEDNGLEYTMLRLELDDTSN
jgi:cell division septation protein DedD